MATMIPPQKGVEYIFYVGLVSQADTKLLQNNPTLAAGDVLVSTDGGATSNLDTLPAVTPASSDMVKVTVSTTEMNGDNIIIVFSDAAGSEWCDLLINIQTSAQSLDAIDTNAVDVAKISGDATSADNLELQYDGTGYVADTAPATQSQLASVTNVGSAVSVHPKAEPNGFVITVGGTETNDEDSTFALDGTKHTLADNGSGVLDCYYEFDIGAGIPTSVTHKGYITGNNDDVGVYGYNWVTTSWVQIGTLEGKSAATVEVNSYDMFTNMVGSAANEGLVRVRFYAASGLSTALLATDQIVLSFSRGNEGYDDGAIWIDTNYSNTGTVVGIDGTSRNPVSTIAAANTLSVSTNLNIFHIAPGSSITFAASQDDQIFMGHDWTLALGGQSISGAYIEGVIVSGVATGASAPTFVECTIGTVTLPPCELRRCGITATITVGSAGDFHLNGCFSEVAGTGTPTFNFGGAIANTNLNMRHWSGGIQLEAMGDTGADTASIEGWGQVIEGTCTSGTVAVRGNFTTSGITNLTLSDNARIDTLQINTEADTALSDIDLDHFIQTSAGAEEPTDGSYLDQIMHKAAGQTFNDTTDSLEAIRDRGDTAWTSASAPAAAAIADAVWDEILSEHTTAGSGSKIVQLILQVLKARWQITGNQLVIYDSDDSTPLYTFDLTNSAGSPSSIRVYQRAPV